MMKLAKTEIQCEPTVSLTENENFEENRNLKSFLFIGTKTQCHAKHFLMIQKRKDNKNPVKS